MLRAATAVAAALATGAVSASTAAAADYDLKSVYNQRSASGVTEYGYIGPRFYVGNGGTSSDWYSCPDGSLVTDWNVVAADEVSTDHSFDVSTRKDGLDTQPFNVRVWNWGLAPLLGLDVVASCTTDRTIFPNHYDDRYLGDSLAYWDAVPGEGPAPRSRLRRADRPGVLLDSGLARLSGRNAGGSRGADRVGSGREARQPVRAPQRHERDRPEVHPPGGNPAPARRLSLDAARACNLQRPSDAPDCPPRPRRAGAHAALPRAEAGLGRARADRRADPQDLPAAQGRRHHPA